jgi:hypothetical protein
VEFIEVDDAQGGTVTFDGRVVEFFSGQNGLSVNRVHVRQVTGVSLDRTGRDERKGRVWFAVEAGRSREAFPFDEADRPRLEALKQAIEGAG